MTKEKVEKELLELENQYWKAIQDGDSDAAMKLTADPCIVAGAQGIGRINKSQLEGMMKAASYKLNDYQIKDVQCQLLTDDVAVMAYKVHEELTVDGKPVSLDAADASTWIKRNGRWMCALHTESVAGDPFGRDHRAKSAKS